MSAYQRAARVARGRRGTFMPVNGGAEAAQQANCIRTAGRNYRIRGVCHALASIGPGPDNKASHQTRLRGVDGIRTRDEGFADPCLTTWPRRQFKKLERAMGFEPTTFSLARRRSTTEPRPLVLATPAGRECRDPGSDWGHRDFQSRALPTELSRPEVIWLLSVRNFTRRT